MSSFHNFEWATDELSRARNKANGRPVQNNTRLFQRGDDSIAVKLHAVDVVTINRDGTWTLRAEGWHTPTTMQRIRGYSPVNLLSEHGEWYIRLEPDPDDPRPVRYDRKVPKPYTPGDFVEKPVKNTDGCQAGSMVGTDHKDEIVQLSFRKDMREDDKFVEVAYVSSTNSDYDSVKVKRSWTSWVFYGEEPHSYSNEEWSNPDTDKTDTVYEQCPHCKAFDAEHERWRYWMHGDRWSRRFDQQTGYATYRKMMDRFHNDKDLWHAAYLADFRARREYLKAEREWDERNRIVFYDGITVDADGYAQRVRNNGPSPAKLRRHEAKVAKMKARIDKYVNGFIAELRKGTMPMPSSGDCWFCCFVNEDGKTWGDMGDNDHLLTHMSERYYVPSLAVNALRERGYKDVGIYIWLDMDQDHGTMGKPGGRYDNIKRDLVAYLSKRMIPTAPTS